MRPKLKEVAWERVGDALHFLQDRRDQLILADPRGIAEALLRALGEGGRTLAELTEQLRGSWGELSQDEVLGMVAQLDDVGLVEDGDRLGGFSPGQSQRYHGNLAFFESFASLSCSREDFQRKLRAAHVLVLGLGGLNSGVAQHLAGLGVGRLTLLDRGKVEAGDFARQYLARWQDLGRSKAEVAAQWLRDLDPALEVSTVDTRVRGPEAFAELVAQVGPDAVAAGVDTPAAMDSWVNAGCVGHGVPFVRGGMLDTQGTIWSVDPGRSACLDCLPAGQRRSRATAWADRGVGPAAGLLAGLGAFELLRYLTRFEPPAYAGNQLFLDFADGCAAHTSRWERDPCCLICGGVEPGESDQR